MLIATVFDLQNIQTQELRCRMILSKVFEQAVS